MKKYLLLLQLFPLFCYAQVRDLRAEVNQTTFDKILGSVTYPFTVAEHREDFPGLLRSVPEIGGLSVDQDDDKNYSLTEIKEMLKWAVEGAVVRRYEDNAEGDIFRQGIKETWDELKAAILAAANDPRTATASGDVSQAELKKWSTLGVEQLVDELDRLEKKRGRRGFEIKAHLAYAKVDLTERPTLQVNSPSFSINTLKVRPLATGELWIKLPHFSCCPIRISWRWKRTASLTVAVKLDAAATATFAVQGLKVLATAQFNKLVLDYPILRDINLAGIINRRLQGRKFEVYDASKFVASIPYIDRHFRISGLYLPTVQQSVAIEIDITQLP